MTEKPKRTLAELWELIVRQKMWIWGFGIIVVAILLLAVSSEFRWDHLIETFAVGLLPVGSFLLIYEYDTRKQYQQMVRDEFSGSLGELATKCGECERFGLLSISNRRDTKRIEDILRSAKSGETISVLGVALNNLAEFERNELIMDAVTRGCAVRFLYLDPDSQEVAAHARDEARDQKEVFGDIAATASIWRSDQDKLHNPKKFQVRKYSAAPKCFLIIHKQGVYVGLYLRGNRGNKCPHFLCAPDGMLAKQYIRHFEQLWDQAQPA